MKLQSILQFFFVLPILPVFANKAASACRCLYGEPCWPNPNEFAVLASQISQPILHPVPPASACYPPSGSGPSNDCSVVIANYTKDTWRSDQPGAMQFTNFETFIFHNNSISACYLNTTLRIPCGQGSVPPVGVDARSESDVQIAVNFAKKNNLKLVVKGTGHDFVGRSTARGSFLIWTHHMNQTAYNSTFVPKGAPVKTENTFNAVTFGAGVQWHDAYDFVQKHGRTVVGGAAQTVGAAGGWVMGRGPSPLSPMFGLGVDNVLQFTIILANGSLVTNNSFQYPDLFWALRGGGGGTYGVVTSVTYKTYPTFPLTVVGLSANSPDIAQNVSTKLIRLHPVISDVGWCAYIDLSNVSLSMFLVAPNASLADTNATFNPFVHFVDEATGEGVEGIPIVFASRLLPRSLAVTDPAKAAKIMLSLDGGVTIFSIAGVAVARVDPDSTGLNPSWRRAVTEVFIVALWSEGSTVDFIFQQIDELKQSTYILDKLTTDSGSYLNEASPYELDFKKSFFGSHYDKLKMIKDKYDPTSLFVVPSGVGSDKWDRELICRLHN